MGKGLLDRMIKAVIIVSVLALGVLAHMPISSPLVPPPPEYLQAERAWIKEEGAGVETWDQYNDTGSRRLNLTYRHSSLNIAYVIRSSDPADRLNCTFIIYRNTSDANGFNASGHLFPGSSPVWNVTISLSNVQTVGEYTYHLFIQSYDPEGLPGLYQMRINVSGTLSGGSSWESPAGNPNVPWMFFRVPSGSLFPVSISDQLGRFTPFFFDTPIPTTLFNATLVVLPPGNTTGVSTAQVQWNRTDGTTIATYQVPVCYVGDGGWAAQSVIPANGSAFPANYTHPYTVGVVLGPYRHSATFHVYPIYAAIPPETWITYGPPSVVDNGTVRFAWIGSDLDGLVRTYHYRMDSGPWVTTNHTSVWFLDLQNGTYRFQVAAEDDDGIWDPSPDSRQFTVLLNQPPDTQILSGPNATTRIRDVTFVWQGSDPDGYVVSYDLRLDGGSWSSTTATSVSYTNLTSGNHTFEVRSRDNKGDVDPTPAAWSFRILPSWCELELQRLLALVEELNQTIRDLEDQLAVITSMLESVQANNSILALLVQQLRAEKDVLTGTVEELRDERARLLGQIHALSAERDDLVEALSICGNLSSRLQEEVERLKGQVTSLNQSVARLASDKAQLERSIQYLLSLIAQLRGRIQDLEAKIPEMPRDFAAGLLGALPLLWVLRIRARSSHADPSRDARKP